MKNSSDNVHYIDGGFRFGDGVRKLHQRIKTLRALELESGSAIEYSGTNNFIMGTGIVYGGLNEFSLSAYDSATTQFTYVYDDGGTGWTEANSNVIDFAHYDDGDGTLGNVGNNKYSVHYVFKHIDDEDVYVVYGTGSYTLAEAEIQAIIPPTKPAHLAAFGCQIGAIVAPQAGGSFAAVIMVTSQFFSGTEVVNHNNLGGLQGGTVDEYYHLTATEYTQAIIKKKLDATQAPTVNNDIDEGYAVGSRWVDVTNDKEYVCLDNTDGAAVWTETTGAGAGAETYLELTDTPAAYDDGKYAKSTAAGVVWDTPAGAGTVDTSGTPVANDIARFTGATTIEGLSYAEFKAALDLEVGTDVQAYSADNAFRTDKLSAFAATTSAELAGVLSDETGTGKAVYSDSPTFTTKITSSKGNFGDSVTVSNDIRAINLCSTNAVIRILRISEDIDTASPALELIHRTTSDGADTSFWDIFVKSTGMYFRDRENDNVTPFTIEEVSPTNSFYIKGTTGYIGIGTSSPSGNLDINVATDADPHFLLSENDATKWDIYNDHTDDNLQVKSGATLRYEFGTDGTANADVAWGTFSPVVEGEGKELLAIALEDANKPVKPYVGIPIVKTDDELFDMIPTEYQEEVNKLDKEGEPVLDKDGKPVKETVTKVKDEKVYRPRKANEFATEAEKQVEYDKYHKVPAKITIANAKYLEYLTGVIDAMQVKIDELEARIQKLEQKEAMK